MRYEPGSRHSRVLKALSPNRWLYRGFEVLCNLSGIVIRSANGDKYAVDNLQEARVMVDQWYLEGTVED